jgi:hypothetical protein
MPMTEENETTSRIEADRDTAGTETEKTAFPRRPLIMAGSILLAVILLGTGLLALAPNNEPGSIPDPENGVVSQEADHYSSRELLKEELEPFYIPLAHEGKELLVRVSFSVTWDKTSSNRFHERKTRVRDRIYLRLTEFATEGRNMRNMAPVLRTEAQQIIEELLRPDILNVVVMGIFID